MVDSFELLISRLEVRLGEPLPGASAQRGLAPATREDPAPDPSERDCREAAVLVLIYPRDGRAHLALTLRSEELDEHAGQISFPGGRREEGESREETALREAREEIGLPADAVRVLGRLSTLYVPPTSFCVYPVVGAASLRPDWSPDHREVAEVIEAPLEELLRAGQPAREIRVLDGREVEVPHYRVDGRRVWGATSMMLAELLTLLREAS